MRHAVFLSTLSLRRATRQRERNPYPLDFYPRSPCGERPYGRINDISRLIFLSTLSLRRATPKRPKHQTQTQNFYPRSPCGERPQGADSEHKMISISIHALLAESDKVKNALSDIINHFYPRSPCGERPMMLSMGAILILFLSTLSLRRATVNGGVL